MVQNMKSVMIFDPKDTDEQTANQFIDWLRNNKPKEVIGRHVPNAAETREYLERLRSS